MSTNFVEYECAHNLILAALNTPASSFSEALRQRLEGHTSSSTSPGEAGGRGGTTIIIPGKSIDALVIPRSARLEELGLREVPQMSVEFLLWHCIHFEDPFEQHFCTLNGHRGAFVVDNAVIQMTKEEAQDEDEHDAGKSQHHKDASPQQKIQVLRRIQNATEILAPLVASTAAAASASTTPAASPTTASSASPTATAEKLAKKMSRIPIFIVSDTLCPVKFVKSMLHHEEKSDELHHPHRHHQKHHPQHQDASTVATVVEALPVAGDSSRASSRQHQQRQPHDAAVLQGTIVSSGTTTPPKQQQKETAAQQPPQQQRSKGFWSNLLSAFTPAHIHEHTAEQQKQQEQEEEKEQKEDHPKHDETKPQEQQQQDSVKSTTAPPPAPPVVPTSQHKKKPLTYRQFQELLQQPQSKHVARALRTFVEEQLELASASSSSSSRVAPPDPHVVHDFIDHAVSTTMGLTLWQQRLGINHHGHHHGEEEEAAATAATETLSDHFEKYIMTKLFHVCFNATADVIAEDAELYKKLAALQNIDPMQGFGCPRAVVAAAAAATDEAASSGSRLRAEWASAVQCLRDTINFKCPRDKLVCITNCCVYLCEAVNTASSSASASPRQNQDAGSASTPPGGERTTADADGLTSRIDKAPPQVGADDFIPALIYCMVVANPEHFLSTLYYVDKYRSQAQMQGETSYYFTTAISGLLFLKSCGASDLRVSKEEYDALFLSSPPQPSGDQNQKKEDTGGHHHDHFRKDDGNMNKKKDQLFDALSDAFQKNFHQEDDNDNDDLEWRFSVAEADAHTDSLTLADVRRMHAEYKRLVKFKSEVETLLLLHGDESDGKN